MWEINKYIKQGNRNQLEGLECQDQILSVEKDGIQVIALADGTGLTNYASMGAKKACEGICELMVEYFEKLYQVEKKLIQYNSIINILSKIYKLCDEYHAELSQFSSTIACVAINQYSNRFIAIHLGDGTIAIERNQRRMKMSYPQNGVNKSYTFLTTQLNAMNHIRVYKGELSDINEFVIYSDGWAEHTKTTNINTMLETAKIETFIDDTSFIALTRHE